MKRISQLAVLPYCLSLVLLLALVFPALAQEKVTITFWNGFTASDGDVLRDIVDQFNDLHRGEIEIEMDIMPWDVFHQKLPPAIATDTAPSFVLMGNADLGEYADQGAIQPVDDIWKSTSLEPDQFVDTVLGMFEYDGHQYGVPMQYNLLYLYWNKDLFQEAGLDPEVPPTTWEEVAEYAIKLTNPRRNQYGFGMAVKTAPPYWLSLIWGNGGEVFDAENRESLINSPQNIESLRLLQEMAVEHRVTPTGVTGPELDNMFRAERIAMYIIGPWVINGLRTDGINFGIAAAPRGPERHQVDMGAVGFYVPVTTSDREREAVYSFIEYWNSLEIAKKWTLINGFPPYLYSAIEDPEIQADPVQSIIAPLGDLGRVWDEGYGYGAMLLSDALWPMIENVLTGAKTPELAVEEADKVMTEILETYH